MSKTLPIGIRLNNPGNLEWGDPWQGLVPRQASMYANSGNAQQQRFAQFESPAYGIRALARTLITYYDKRRARDGSKIDTVREIIERWAPAFENDVASYAAQVGRALCAGCDRPGDVAVNMHDYEQLRIVVEAIIRHENGPGPLRNANTWFSDATVAEGLRLAGVRKPTAPAVPVTKETLGATTAGAVGVAQVAEVLPQISEALSSADSHLSSGSVVRIVLGVLTIGIAVFIAYSQVKRKQAGQL